MAGINEIISKSAISGIIKTTEELEKAYLKIQDIIVSSRELNSSLSAAKGLASVQKQVDATAIANERLRKAVAATQLQEERLASFRANEEIKEAARQKKREEQGAKALGPYKQLSNQYNEVANRAQNLGAQISILNKQFGATPTEEQTAKLNALSTAFDKAQKEAAELHQQLLAIDRSVGKNQRNVGNYRSAFDGLGNSINQLTRELPAFAVSVQTGILALSNNIPIFFDQFKQTRAEIKALRAEGKETQGMLGRLASSFFSFSTLLSIGVTLLTIYGKEVGEFFKALFFGSKALDIFAEKQRILGEAMKSADFLGAAKNVLELKINVDLAKNGLLDKEKVLRQYNETIGKTTGEVKTLDEAEKALVKNGDAYIKMTLLKAAAQIALDESAKKSYEAEVTRRKQLSQFSSGFSETQGSLEGINTVTGEVDYKKRQERERKLINERAQRRRDEFNATKNAANLQLQIAKDFQKQAAEIAKGMNFDFFGGQYEDKSKSKKDLEAQLREERAALIQNRIDVLEIQKKYFDDVANNEKFSYETRLDALRNFNETSLSIAELTSQKEKTLLKLTSKEKAEGKKVSNAQLNQIDIEYLATTIGIQEDISQRTLKIMRDSMTESEQIRQLRNQREISNIQKERDEELAILVQAFNLRGDYSRKALEKLEEDRLVLSNKYAKEEVKRLFQQTENEIAIRKKTGEQTFELENQLAALRLRYQDLELKEGDDKNKKRLDKERELQDQLKQLYQETFDFAVALTNGAFEKNIQRLEKEKKAATEKKDRDVENIEESANFSETQRKKEIKRINESTLSQKEKDKQISDLNKKQVTDEEAKQEQIAIINSQAEAKQKEIDARIAAQKRKQAIADKAAALAQIAINTAVATTKTLGQTGIFGLPLTSILIAFGALQAATVLAQPIPEFRHGGTMKHDGIAKFGEEGRELRLNPDGSTELTPANTTYGYVQKGTKFFTANDTKRILSKPEKLDYAGKSWDVSGIIASQEKTASRVEKAVSKIKSPSSILTKHGLHRQTIKASTLNNYYKKNLS